MKKALLFLAVLCMAGVFSAKAQSASDSAYVRDLNFIYINTSSMPVTTTGALTSTSKILKDIHPGKAAIGYAFSLSQTTMLDIRLAPPASGSWDGYLNLLDANYNVLARNDDFYFDSVRGSRIIKELPAGTYYVLVSNFDYGHPSTNLNFTLYMAANTAVPLRSLTYTPTAANTTFTDSLGSASALVADSTLGGNSGYYPHCKGYSIQIQPSLLSVRVSQSNLIIIFDNNYNVITYSNSSVSCNITTAGTYRIVVVSRMSSYENDTTLSTPYTMSINANTIETIGTLTATPITSLTDTVKDTLATNSPAMVFPGGNFFVKLYSFQGTQNKIVKIKSDAHFALYDNNRNLIAYSNNNKLVRKLTNTGTYYVVVAYSTAPYPYWLKIDMFDLPTYYVDGLNGNDARNGLTPSTAFATLDTAVARSGGIGKYYLTEDYTFGNSTNLATYHSEIYPYGKDIHLKITDDPSLFVYVSECMVFGSQDSNHYFIIDSCHTGLSYGLFLGREGCHIELNKVKVRNSYFPDDFITYADDVVLRDCEFSNDTIGDDFIQTNYNIYNSVKLINVDFSHNNLGYYFVYNYNSEQYRVDFSMENTNVVGNTFSATQKFFNFDIDLKSGSWRNNNLESAVSYNSNPNLSTQNCAGIWARDSSIVTIGAGFTMDANNYLCLDSLSTINITENLTAPLVAQVYPYRYRWDGVNSLYVANYYEGRRLLSGSASLLRANYSKFAVAQAASQLWYLHPDGTIHSYTAGIETADNAAVRMYPNPASNVLNIALEGSEVNEVVIIDIYGKTVVRNNVADGTNSLDISSLPAGMYFVQLCSNGQVEATKKLVKK